MLVKASAIGQYYFRGKSSDDYFYAVSQTDLSLTEKELVVITGRSGSGKSTLLNILAGLQHPAEGKVFIDGADLYAMDDASLSRFRNENIGVVPQRQTPIESLTVAENVCLPYRLYHADDAVCSFAGELLERVGLGSLMEEMPSHLSGGELRRLALARALVMRPRLLLADEPTNDLDDENTRQVLQLLKDFSREGACVLLVTHEVCAAAFGDRCFRMDAGVLAEQDAP